MKTAGLYIHIPFCKQKCYYCDFFSVTIEDKFFYKYLIKELNLYSGIGVVFDTIYFGGGTPSFFSSSGIKKILNFIFDNFNLTENLEITIEANPESINCDNVSLYSDIGINRISLGVQSLDDDILKYIGRLSNRRQIFKSIEIIKNSRIENINFDLIFGLPNQLDISILNDLKELIKFSPTHFSVYNLILHKNSILYNKIKHDKIVLEDERDTYYKIIDFLSIYNYNQYEISNFSLTGYECKHNLHYWNYDNFLGIGPSASGFINNFRYTNEKNFYIYKNKINENLYPIKEKEYLSKTIIKKEYIMMNLRKTKGINLYDYNVLFKNDFIKEFNNSIDNLKKLNLVDYNENNFFITKKGYYLSNSIIENLWQDIK